jgi:cytochrome c biogenesis protein CcdA
MVTLIALVVSIAVADSLNPSTLGPALYYASGRHGRRDVAGFGLGVLVVSFAGGLALIFGPGHQLLNRFKAPSTTTVHVIELVAGGAALPVAALLWRARARIAVRLAQRRRTRGRSAALLGAGIMAVELPTALPYFAAIAAIVESGRSDTAEIVLVALYNGAFVAPIVVLFIVLALAGRRGVRIAIRARRQLHHWAPRIAPAALVAAAAVLLTLGSVGLAR